MGGHSTFHGVLIVAQIQQQIFIKLIFVIHHKSSPFKIKVKLAIETNKSPFYLCCEFFYDFQYLRPSCLREQETLFKKKIIVIPI